MAKFLCKYPNQILCMVPNRTQVFDGIAMPVPGKRIEFQNGQYETDDKKEVDFIRKHRMFDTDITEVDNKQAGA